MATFSEALRALMPAPEAEEVAYPVAFGKMAHLLLNEATLFVAGLPHRLTEVEFYFNGGKHLDSFAHGFEIQKHFGKWYFHRMGNEYRSGSYKGLDVAIGHNDWPGGVLIRGVEPLDGKSELLDGPCMFVDHLLELNGAPDIASLVAKFDLSIDKPAQGSSPLFFERTEDRKRPVLTSARVGLSLKKSASAARQHFLAKPYRYLTEPGRIKKGRVQLVLGLHVSGMSAAQISQLTGTSVSNATKYIKLFEQGRSRSPEQFRGDLGTNELCEVLGACQKLL